MWGRGWVGIRFHPWPFGIFRLGGLEENSFWSQVGLDSCIWLPSRRSQRRRGRSAAGVWFPFIRACSPRSLSVAPLLFCQGLKTRPLSYKSSLGLPAALGWGEGLGLWAETGRCLKGPVHNLTTLHFYVRSPSLCFRASLEACGCDMDRGAVSLALIILQFVVALFCGTTSKPKMCSSKLPIPVDTIVLCQVTELTLILQVAPDKFVCQGMQGYIYATCVCVCFSCSRLM